MCADVSPAARPMNYYTSLMVLLLGFKLLLACMLFGPFVWRRFRRGACRRFALAKKINARLDNRHAPASTDVETSFTSGLSSSRHNRTSAMLALGATPRVEGVRDTATHAAVASGSADTDHDRDVNWSRVLRSSFMLLLIAYPGLSLKVMRLFKV